MTEPCVNCRRPIIGRPYNSESWVGSWCSAECQAATDQIRESAYARRKGETMTSTRQDGETTRMLRDLGPGRSIVITHTDRMYGYIRDLVQRLNAEDGRGRDVDIRSVHTVAHVWRLRAETCPIVVDHAFWMAPIRDEVAGELSAFIQKRARGLV